jgi:hypothetical protein
LHVITVYKIKGQVQNEKHCNGADGDGEADGA